MASNIVTTFPPATGAQLPPVELKAFGNEVASTKVSDQNYVTTILPTSPGVGNIHTREQVCKNIQEYPR